MTNQNQTTTQQYKQFDQNNCGMTIPFDKINEPGTYLCNWTGHLLRVPEDGVAPGRSPLLSIVGCEPLWATKISENPYITITKARMLASNYDLNVNF